MDTPPPGWVNIDDDLERIASATLDAAFVAHRELGPGCRESVYVAFVEDELRKHGFEVHTEVHLPIQREGRLVSDGIRLDMIVERQLIVEFKVVAKVLPVHEAQVITYLSLTRLPLGFLLNFNVPLLREGIRRFVRPVRSPAAFARTDLL